MIYSRGLKHAARQRCQCGPRLSFKLTKLQILIIERQKRSNMAKFCTKYGIFFHIVARRALLIQNCGPWRHYPSKCGPSMDLSLRPLIYRNTHIQFSVVGEIFSPKSHKTDSTKKKSFKFIFSCFFSQNQSFQAFPTKLLPILHFNSKYSQTISKQILDA